MSQSNEPVASTIRATLPLPFQGTSRRVIDEMGVLWKISERPNGFDRRHGWSLVFESDRAVRSIVSYPGDWHSLEAAELIELNSLR